MKQVARLIDACDIMSVRPARRDRQDCVVLEGKMVVANLFVEIHHRCVETYVYVCLRWAETHRGDSALFAQRNHQLDRDQDHILLVQDQYSEVKQVKV